ncbi:MAG: hypothetical protein GY846_05735 [Deltaproteobacteria bacterium]|nr:hypothetical protein [Deltaproteobacteria bacterium]
MSEKGVTPILFDTQYKPSRPYSKKDKLGVIHFHFFTKLLKNEGSDLTGLLAPRAWGSKVLTSFLLGTLSNIAFALVPVGLGRWIRCLLS